MSRFPSFRQSSGSPRRSTARAADASPVAIAFDRWLDGRMPGWSTPGAADEPAQSLSEADRLAFASLTETVHRIERLDASSFDDVDTRIQANCWEDIMQATISTTPTPMLTLGVPALAPLRGPDRRSLPDGRTRTGGFARLSPVLNVAMAALLVLMLGLSAWAVTGHRSGGSGKGPGGTEGFASLAALDPNATPASTTQGILPTADECTTQPLTVDEVMERLTPALEVHAEDRGRIPPWIPSAILPSPVAGKIDYDLVTIVPKISTATPSSAMPVDLALSDIAGVQRQVMACFVAQDPFRIWALIAPGATYWSFLAWSLVQYVDPHDVRSAIEDLEGKTGSERMSMLTKQGYGLINRMPLVNPDSTASAYGIDGDLTVVRVSTLAYDVNHVDRLPIVRAIDQTYETWLYVYDESSHRWLVDNIGDFGPMY